MVKRSSFVAVLVTTLAVTSFLTGQKVQRARVKAHPVSENVEKRLIDVILFDSELDMLHYRLRLHKDFVDEFVTLSQTYFLRQTKEVACERKLD